MAGRDRPHLCIVTNLSAPRRPAPSVVSAPLLLWAQDAAAAIASHRVLLSIRGSTPASSCALRELRSDGRARPDACSSFLAGALPPATTRPLRGRSGRAG